MYVYIALEYIISATASIYLMTFFLVNLTNCTPFTIDQISGTSVTSMFINC